MFSLFTSPLPQSEPPKNVPPPTPVYFPHYAPELTAHAAQPAARPSINQLSDKALRLTDVLQSIVRPAELRVKHFEALGVRIHENADAAALIPNARHHVPDFATWDDIPYDQARDINDSTRRPISNGNRSPGIQIYLDRKRELSIDNTTAFRTVRRVKPTKPGTPPVRLGNAYEFYRYLDTFTQYWDDTSLPAAEDEKPVGTADAESGSNADTTTTTPSLPEFKAYRTHTGSDMPTEFRVNMITAFIKLVAYDFGCNVTTARSEPRLYLNTGTVTVEEAEALDKLHKTVKDEVEKSRAGQKEKAETKPPAPAPAPPPAPPQSSLPTSIKYKGPASYFSSGCIFIFRSPMTREAARAGIVEGPLAAVSARHTTTFLSDEERAALASPDADRDVYLDLARELLAALVTAQHRAREGRAERRVGKGEWWCTKPRWGGGSGGPIGREIDSAPNTDEAPDLSSAEGGGSGGSSGRAAMRVAMRASASASASSASSASPIVSSYTVPGVPPVSNKRPSGTISTGGAGARSGLGGGGSGHLGSVIGGILGGAAPSDHVSSGSSSSSASKIGSAAKKQRLGMAMYDNYRMVRPPAASWDKKTRYMAIGRDRRAHYDDVFVVSSLFHHVSIVRVRVPTGLLEALDGAAPGDASVADSALQGLEVVRSPWYDYFRTEDRLAAMRMAWGMMAYLMRADGDDGSNGGKGDDVAMKDVE